MSLGTSAHGGLYNTDVDRSSLIDDYDGANRLLEERLDIGDGDKSIAYGYTADSLISQITYPGGTVMGRTYNSRRQLHEVALNSVTQATHAYDTASRRTGRTYVNGTGTTWGYDLNSRTTTLSHATTGMAPAVFQAWDYRYTDAGNPLVQDDTTPGSTTRGEAYQYDGLHRLTNYQSGTVSGNTVPTPTAYQDWTLSKLGNWTAWDNDGANETRTHNNINALTARSTVANPLAYDTNFNLIDDGDKYTYEYDANDKLKIVRDRTTTAVVAEYRYDALGRRVEKEVGSDVTRYYHSGEQIIEERDGSDAVVATYTYGDYIDEPLTMDRASERYYYHTNRMYSIYALTDSAGDLIERYSYTPYGVTTTYDDAYANSQPTSRVDNPYTYTGRELDAETLLMHYRARIYDPVTGRFRQLDPIGFRAGDLNLYAYVLASPVRYTDSTGLKCECSFKDTKLNFKQISLACNGPIATWVANNTDKIGRLLTTTRGSSIRTPQGAIIKAITSGTSLLTNELLFGGQAGGRGLYGLKCDAGGNIHLITESGDIRQSMPVNHPDEQVIVKYPNETFSCFEDKVISDNYCKLYDDLYILYSACLAGAEQMAIPQAPETSDPVLAESEESLKIREKYLKSLAKFRLEMRRQLSVPSINLDALFPHNTDDSMITINSDLRDIYGPGYNPNATHEALYDNELLRQWNAEISYGSP